jgi:hypothetical protein
MKEILLQGTLVDLKGAEEETQEVTWQTKSLKKQINKVGIRSKGLTMPLDGKDVTNESIDLVEDFLPDIRLSGLELRSERNSKAWGGSYLRVVEETNNPDHICIQHVYVWTKQRFFISIWVTVLPLFLLGIMGTLIYSYLTFQTAVVSIMLIGAIFFGLGAIQLSKALRGLTKGAFNFSNQHLFVLFGLVMWSLLLEMFLTKPAPINSTSDIIAGAEDWHPEIPVDELVGNFVVLEKKLRFSYVSAIFIIAGIVALYFWWREPPSFTHATHEMDWAPFFVYLKKKGTNWELEKVKYDNFHYYAGTKTKAELQKEKAISRDGKRARFTIPNFWHSFEPKVSYAPWFSVTIGLLIFVLTALLAYFSFTSGGSTAIGATTVRFVIIPLLLFFGAYLAFSKWPTHMVDKNADFSDPVYHITDKKLHIFWNLKGDEPAFKVRSKFQDPFMDDEHFDSFRDDLEQMMLFSVLPKIRELEQELQESFFRRL